MKRITISLLALLLLASTVYADSYLPIITDTGPVIDAEADDCRPLIAGFVDVWPEESGAFLDLYQWPVQHCASDPVVVITAYSLSAPVGVEAVSTRGTASGFVVEGRVDMSTHIAGEPLRLQFVAVGETR